MLRQQTRTLQATAAFVDAIATALAFLAAYYGAGRLLQHIPQWHFKQVLPLGRYVWMLCAVVPLSLIHI